MIRRFILCIFCFCTICLVACSREGNQATTPLMKAVSTGNKARVKHLLKQDANVLAVLPGTNDTLLMMAIKYPDILEMLLEKDSSNINAQTNDGWTALMLASLNAPEESIELLLKHGANTEIKDNEVHILFNVPCPPLCFDTISVRKISNYGFNVIRKDDADIISDIKIDGDTIIIKCKESPIGCKMRYAVNGEYLKSGWRIGPRGNLRDSQGNTKQIEIIGKTYALHNWCYQFDYLVTKD